MAQSKEEQAGRFPLAVYNFRVFIGPAVGPRDFPIEWHFGEKDPKGTQCLSFTEISGIAVQYEHVTYRHGLSFWEGESIQTFWQNRFMPITCKRGTVLGADPTYLYTWLKDKFVRRMAIELCDEKGKPVYSWHIAAAVPVALKAPTFSATSNDVSIDTLELQVKGVTVGAVRTQGQRGLEERMWAKAWKLGTTVAKHAQEELPRVEATAGKLTADAAAALTPAKKG